MTDHTDGDALLAKIMEGLEGVSPGDWEADTTKVECDSGPFTSYMLMDAAGKTIADAINSDAAEILWEGPSGPDDFGSSVDILANANFEHFARCSPPNIRSISAAMKAKDSEIERLRAALSSIADCAYGYAPDTVQWIRDHALEALKGGEADD